MTSFSDTILQSWQVRKTKAQKTAFIEFLRSRYPELQIEQAGRIQTRNLILGDIRTAKVVFSAHYDTCARMLVPNFITPRNLPVYIIYNILIALPFLAAMFGVWFLLMYLGLSNFPSFFIAYVLAMGLMFWLLMGGKPNPHTANDNTSGVITLLELYDSLTDAERKECAFVFFDLEEAGLVGSSRFAKLHKQDMKDKLLVNFDCVSEGDHMLFVINKKTRKSYGPQIEQAFSGAGDFVSHFCRSSSTMYPSDQANFPVSVGVAAMQKKKLLGLYMDKIHTPKDTVFQAENIHFLVSGAQRLIHALSAGRQISSAS